MILWCENSAAVHIPNNQIFYGRTKYIEVDRQYIREKVKKSVIELKHETI